MVALGRSVAYGTTIGRKPSFGPGSYTCMKLLLFFFSPLLIFNVMTIFDFDRGSDLRNWSVVGDVVMGGRSDGWFSVNDEGNAVFQGKVSLENNGGFSMVKYRFAKIQTSVFTRAVIRLRGDGKRYQFRVKAQDYDRHSYVTYFETTGEWQTIEIPLGEMHPVFRGQRLGLPDYPRETMSEVAFLIGNKKAEVFRLEIDNIQLQ